ncbi:hypothetical protein D3C75_954770 [compost metagenome]
MVEQGERRVVAEQVDAAVAKCRAVAVGVVIAVEQVDVVTTLLAPGRQQWVCVLVQGLRVEHNGHAGLARLTFVLVP